MIDFTDIANNISGADIALVIVIGSILLLIFLLVKLITTVLFVKDKIETSVSYVEMFINLIKKIKGKK